MKRIYTILMASMLTCSAFAQHRYHPEIVGENTSADGLTKVQHKVGLRSTAPLPCMGRPNVPVVLVQFADLKFCSDTLNVKDIEHSDENVNAFYQKYCNGSGVPNENYTYSYGSYGSVVDYFIEQSDSLYQPHFEVIGPVTLPYTLEHYGRDASDNSKDANINAFYQDAIKASIDLGVDWSKFDNDKDGKYDFVFFIYAGEGQNAYGNMTECAKDGDPTKAYLIWPKESAVDFTVQTTVGKFKFGGYGMTNEMYGTRTDGVGTMCHELSHGLGLPDLYNTGNYKEDCFGMDYWDIMDAGNYCRVGRCPCAYNTYQREFMGWRKLETLASLTEPQTITLEPIQRGGKGYKLVNPSNPSEYYILENRQRIGFDSYLGLVTTSHNGLKITETYGFNHGMMVIHIDYLQSAWTSNGINTKSHPRYTILPADGQLLSSIASLEGYTDRYFESMACDLYPGYKKVTSIPSDRFTLYTGGTLPINITNIREEANGTIVVDINGGDQTAIEGIVSNESVTSNASTYYDLMGRPVLQPTRGFYIKDGRKVFVK